MPRTLVITGTGFLKVRGDGSMNLIERPQGYFSIDKEHVTANNIRLHIEADTVRPSDPNSDSGINHIAEFDFTLFTKKGVLKNFNFNPRYSTKYLEWPTGSGNKIQYQYRSNVGDNDIYYFVDPTVHGNVSIETELIIDNEPSFNIGNLHRFDDIDYDKLAQSVANIDRELVNNIFDGGYANVDMGNVDYGNIVYANIDHTNILNYADATRLHFDGRKYHSYTDPYTGVTSIVPDHLNHVFFVNNNESNKPVDQMPRLGTLNFDIHDNSKFKTSIFFASRLTRYTKLDNNLAPNSYEDAETQFLMFEKGVHVCF
tara:strand:- start:553 stop:1494 length:942 start_codon:yes stop_codon:yes gene_type:complete